MTTLYDAEETTQQQLHLAAAQLRAQGQPSDVDRLWESAAAGARPVRLDGVWMVEGAGVAVCGQPGDTLGSLVLEWHRQMEKR